MDWDAGRCLNDYASATLRPQTLAAAKALLGRELAELASDEIDRIEATHRRLQAAC